MFNHCGSVSESEIIEAAIVNIAKKMRVKRKIYILFEGLAIDYGSNISIPTRFL